MFIADCISTVMNSEPVFTAYINGRAAATISSTGTLNAAIYSLLLDSTELDAGFGDGALPPVINVPDINFAVNYKFALTNGGNPPAGEAECYKILSEVLRQSYSYAFTLYADNAKIAQTAHYNDAQKAIETLERTLTESARNTGADVDEVRIANSINVKYGLVQRSQILSAEGLYARLENLLAPGINTNPQASSVSDSVDPAIEYGINRIVTNSGAPIVAASFTAAPELATENIKVESAASLIPYKTVYVESDKYFVGESFLRTPGVAGLESVTYDIVMDGLDITQRRIASRTVITPPVDEVFVVGTRELPPPIPTGSFDYPITAYKEITSGFGEQRAKFDGDAYHYGVDFSAINGTPIYASDGGTITFTGYNKSYGLMIEIDHGGGVTSRYAHCSKLIGAIGEAVYKGKQIALVGDTGVSTGFHLHFEIRKNNVCVNPISLIDK